MKIQQTFSLFTFHVSLSLLCAGMAFAKEFTGPTVWETVNTNAVKAWQASQEARKSATVRVWPGVVADTERREVRLLVEAVGHNDDTTMEFLIVGPQSNRAYESVTVSVSQPSDIVRALESLGVPRGNGVDGQLFRFWPYGERISATIRNVNEAPQTARPLQSVIKDKQPENPLYGEGGLVFTGGLWTNGVCGADMQQPASVMALYNEPDTLFDVPFLASKGAAYGRSTLVAKMKYGEVMEIVLKPMPLPGGGIRAIILSATAEPSASQETMIVCADKKGEVLKKGTLTEVLTWMKTLSDRGHDLFVTLTMSDELTLAQAEDITRVFVLLDGKGLKLYGKTKEGIYPRAFLPQEAWRKRDGRTPQPFEVYLAGDSKKLTYIEEDWSGAGLDPKLAPKDYPFAEASELPGLVKRVGDKDSKKVELLFVFASRNEKLKSIMPVVRMLADRLPLVYLFGEP
jgi:hypothetical protein